MGTFLTVKLVNLADFEGSPELAQHAVRKESRAIDDIFQRRYRTLRALPPMHVRIVSGEHAQAGIDAFWGSYEVKVVLPEGEICLVRKSDYYDISGSGFFAEAIAPLASATPDGHAQIDMLIDIDKVIIEARRLKAKASS